jgi:hypothetical protein
MYTVPRLNSKVLRIENNCEEMGDETTGQSNGERVELQFASCNKLICSGVVGNLPLSQDIHSIKSKQAMYLQGSSRDMLEAKKCVPLAHLG